MKLRLSLITFSILFVCPELGLAEVVADSKGKHLFILSGQSNMGGLKPEESFIPTVEKRFGKENVIVIKDAQGGQPIRRWDKQWKPSNGNQPKNNGDLYARLMKKVNAQIKGEKFQTITFLWMQGERDAREKHGDVYEASFKRLLDQLQTDLNYKEINFVIGRLSDYDMANKVYGDWTKMRTILVKLAEENPRGEWVDTDDLNDGLNRRGKEIKNDLHYSAKGYVTFGKRLADKAILLIEKNSK